MSRCHDVRGTDDDDSDGAVDTSRDSARVGCRYQARANGKEHDRGRVRENVRDASTNFRSESTKFRRTYIRN